MSNPWADMAAMYSEQAALDVCPRHGRTTSANPWDACTCDERKPMQSQSFSSVSLVEYMGGDKAVVNSARVSFNQDNQNATELEKGDAALINFLMRNRHGTPFESTVLTFRISTPIAVAREWFRHRIGSFNEISGRYIELPQQFFIPDCARMQTGKPGAYSYQPMPRKDTETMQRVLEDAYESASTAYDKLLDMGVAKEQARLVLPVGIFTHFYWTVNARSLMNFLELRLASNAMQEIREAAEVVLMHFGIVAPITAKTFNVARVAP